MQLACSARYDNAAKQNYRRFVLTYFRSLAKKLNLRRGDYSIRFNPGGVAVGGDATLHHNHFYLSLNENGCFWRPCEGQRDYIGGLNHWLVSQWNVHGELQFLEDIGFHLEKQKQRQEACETSRV